MGSKSVSGARIKKTHTGNSIPTIVAKPHNGCLPAPRTYVVSVDPKGVKDVNGKNLQPGDEATVHFDKEERQDVGLHLK